MLNLHPSTITFIYYHVLFILVIFSSFNLVSTDHSEKQGNSKAILLVIFLLILIGFRPISGQGVGQYFGDTVNYYSMFMYKIGGNKFSEENDPGFVIFTNFFVLLESPHLYFFVISFIYLFAYYWSSKRLTKKYSYLLLLAIVSSFGWWAGAVNGIRSGMASALILLGMSFYREKWKMLLLFFVAISLHLAMLLPVLAFFLTLFYPKSKAYITGWFLSIFLSAALGEFWESFFAGLGLLGDDRFANYLLSDEFDFMFSRTGFRWDFLVYSSLAVFLGYYYIYKRKFTNDFYIRIFNTYLIANSFWILVIRSTNSNRFAVLSWFLIPIVILFPLFSIKLVNHQNFKIAIYIILSFVFTYLLSTNYII